ncbi:hypothetical protein ACVWZ9_003124 [Pseudomonas chlororaphis]
MSDEYWVQTFSLEVGIPKTPALKLGFSVMHSQLLA